MPLLRAGFGLLLPRQSSVLGVMRGVRLAVPRRNVSLEHLYRWVGWLASEEIADSPGFDQVALAAMFGDGVSKRRTPRVGTTGARFHVTLALKHMASQFKEVGWFEERHGLAYEPFSLGDLALVGSALRGRDTPCTLSRNVSGRAGLLRQPLPPDSPSPS